MRVTNLSCVVYCVLTTTGFMRGERGRVRPVQRFYSRSTRLVICPEGTANKVH